MTRASRRSRWSASTRLGDDVSLPVVRGTHTLHLSDTVSVERGRHFFKVGGEVRHYRSDGYNHVFPRGQLNFFGAFTGSGIADVLLGYPDGDAAGDQRQPAGAADDGGEPVRAGRLAGDHAADRERGPALRVQQAAGGRRRPHGDLRPGDGDAAAGGAGRRAARGHRRRLEQRRAARRRQLAAERRRLVAAARRLRHLLRRQHAHRELRALLQPAVSSRSASSRPAARCRRPRRSVSARPRASSRPSR